MSGIVEEAVGPNLQDGCSSLAKHCLIDNTLLTLTGQHGVHCLAQRS